MAKLTKVSPSIIAIDYTSKEVLDETLKKLKEAKAELVHLDVMDGKFVKNKTFDHNFVEYIKNKTDFILDVHLMVENPELVIDDYLKAGADILTIHFEAVKDTKKLEQLLEKIKSQGVLAGVSIKIETLATCLAPIIKKNLVDVVLVMSVKPGACGREFNPQVLEKITYFKKFYPKLDIEVDGGINADNSKDLIKAGADILVSGSYLFNSANLQAAIKSLKK